MFKKQLILAVLVLLTFGAMAQSGTTKKNPFYYELISNESKTTNFVFGFYPTTYTWEESKDIEGFTHVKAAVINSATGALEWNNYKINILLKSGKLIRSYTTVAKEGDFACNYIIKGSETHYQYFCFHTKFTADDINKVWLVLGDDQIFNLMFDKNE